jgi:hypothetical protein
MFLDNTKKKHVGVLQKKATTNLLVLNGYRLLEDALYCQDPLRGLIATSTQKQ